MVIKRTVGKLKRFCVHAGFPVTRNNRELRKLRDRHRGQKAFILGMGPSLKVADIEKIRQNVTFACNKIFLCFDETDWRPDYYSVIDIKVAENLCDEFSRLSLKKIFGASVRPAIKNDKNIIWINGGIQPWEGNVNFSTNPFKGFYGGHTVLFFQIQLAWFMGIRELYLLGLDFSFKIPTERAGQSIHGEILVNNDEINHFHPDYRKPGETWTMPELGKQRQAFASARKFIEAHGGRLLNCSRETQLDVLERMPLEDAIR